ncbi:alanine/ornithine racemase family PLP-dependent enzyme [Orenia marismortui]|uniref:Putative amino acid racemase n=1 Tax=Orenia marismortui TaxID=46469 RepID=A0A4R8H372_9FIRM|nr:alanine/ornithine racemase family PLP-dependent enzyme [Orenia marismortui]TDX50926.1 putative amino acid racemase [Orenia marismortui]
MALNPRIEINLSKINYNAKQIVKFSHKKGIQIWGVTKGVRANLEVAKSMLSGGVVGLADSRLSNLERLKKLGCPLMLIRIPMLSEIQKVVELVDISLNSELKVIEELNEVAKSMNKVHNVILMIDLGDRREGVLPKDTLKIADKINKLSNIKLVGVGSNLACFRGILPNEYNMMKLMNLVKDIREEIKIELPIISAGNSSSLPLLINEDYIPIANQLRVGETILLGREVGSGNKFPLTRLDTVKLVAEVIELKDKPTLLRDEESKEELIKNNDKEIIKRGILGIGKQDIVPEGLFPMNQKITIEGASSDHLIVDLSCVENINLGDEIEFRLSYEALLQAMTSPYVNKICYKEEE